MADFLPPLAVLMALACSDPAPAPDDGAGAEDTDDDLPFDSGGWDSGAPDGEPPEVTEETLPDQVMSDDWIFAQDVIHEVVITLPQASWDALYAAPRELTPGDVSFDGVEIAQVGVRLRGKIGSFRTLDGKPKLEVDFNRYVEDQRLYGLESLSFNSSIVDCSYVKEPLGYALFAAMGVPASRSAFAHITINDRDYGLYVIIETTDDRFTRRHWGEPVGNLYDGKYVLWPDNSYTLLDFGEGHDELYQLEEGTDVGHVDIASVTAAYIDGTAAGDFHSRAGAVVNWDNLHRMWAVEQWMGQNDGYCMNKNNYRVYFDAEDGLMRMIPWDLDHSFLEDYEWGRSWPSPYGNLARACFADAACAAEHRVVVTEMLTVVEGLDLPGLATQLETLTDAAARADPRRECAETSIDSYRAHVNSWLTTRSASVRTMWGL
jgi:hypothetical protein